MIIQSYCYFIFPLSVIKVNFIFLLISYRVPKLGANVWTIIFFIFQTFFVPSAPVLEVLTGCNKERDGAFSFNTLRDVKVVLSFPCLCFSCFPGHNWIYWHCKSTANIDRYMEYSEVYTKSHKGHILSSSNSPQVDFQFVTANLRLFGSSSSTSNLSCILASLE